MKIDNVHFHLGSAVSAALLAAIAGGKFQSAPTSGAPNPTARVVPALGHYWRGEGGVYCGIGRGFEGIPDHHLILANAPSAMFVKRVLGTYGVDVAGATSDHNGMANTIALAEAGSELCKEILALEIEGHQDFCLMSRTDARLCGATVPEQFEKEWYLLSTQYSSGYAWMQYFDSGYQSNYNKKFEARARVVRRLPL